MFSYFERQRSSDNPIARVHNNTEKSIEHWNNVKSGRLHVIIYEENWSYM